MKDTSTISVIIPCFNDGKHLVSIVEEIKKTSIVDEIIIVDDGSNQQTKDTLRHLDGVHLITHIKNLGKTKALWDGVQAAKNEVVLFVDSDLRNFSYEHVEKLFSTFTRGDYDLVMGIRECEVACMQWIGFAQAYTGERIVKKHILIDHVELFNVKGFLIEPALNKLFFKQYKVGETKLKGVGQTYKIFKMGLKGLLADWKMMVDYVRYLGMKEFLYQLKFAKEMDE